MANTNRKLAPSEAFYPELQPVTVVRRRVVRSQQSKVARGGEWVFYLMVNAALIFGLVQFGRTMVQGSMDLSRLISSHASVQHYHAETQAEHQLLSDKIQIYSSPSGIEELARNYLNMVGHHELPVRIQ